MEKYQVMPELTPGEYEDLKSDIAEKGVMVSHVTVLAHKNEFASGQSDQVQNISGADGKSYPPSEKQAEQQRRDIREAIKNNPKMNNHQVAQELGVSDHTAAKQRQKMGQEPAQYSAESSDTEEDTWEAPHKMTPAEDLKMALEDHVNGLDGALHDLLDDYEYEDDKRDVFFVGRGRDCVRRTV